MDSILYIMEVIENAYNWYTDADTSNTGGEHTIILNYVCQ